MSYLVAFEYSLGGAVFVIVILNIFFATIEILLRNIYLLHKFIIVKGILLTHLAGDPSGFWRVGHPQSTHVNSFIFIKYIFFLTF